MTNFTESEHPRNAGKFTDKRQSDPEVLLGVSSFGSTAFLIAAQEHSLRSAEREAFEAQDRLAKLAIESASTLVRSKFPTAAAFTITTWSGGYPTQYEIVGGEALDAAGKPLGHISSDKDIAKKVGRYANLAGADWLKLNLPRHPTPNAAWRVNLA
jgi:hypothetical protein